MSKHLRIVLASTSPRRIELLSALGLKIEVASPDADETPAKGETPRALVRRLARAKAESVSRKLRGRDAIVIAADTIVVSPSGRILGKPRDASDARKMLGEIQGKAHHVLTGYCITEVRDGDAVRAHAQVCSSRVKMRALSRAQIDAYVRTGEPMDKAGAYAIQGLGAAFISSVSGNYTNVVGLPVEPLLKDLEEHFGLSTFSWLEGTR